MSRWFTLVDETTDEHLYIDREKIAAVQIEKRDRDASYCFVKFYGSGGSEPILSVVRASLDEATFLVDEFLEKDERY